MRRKHQGLASLALLAVSLVIAGGYAAFVLWQDEAPAPVVRLKPLPAMSLPNRAALEDLNQLETRMGSLSQPRMENLTPVNLALFGYEASSLPLPVETDLTTTTKMPVSMNYMVTMTFSGGSKRLCVIDGAIYRQGAELPDGGRVVSITSRRVLISKQGTQAWVPVVAWYLQRQEKPVYVIKDRKADAAAPPSGSPSTPAPAKDQAP